MFSTYTRMPATASDGYMCFITKLTKTKNATKLLLITSLMLYNDNPTAAAKNRKPVRSKSGKPHSVINAALKTKTPMH